jgi:site-specific recombinase XerD
VAKFLEYYANCGIAKNTLQNYKQCIEANTFHLWNKKRVNEFSTAELRDFIQIDMSKFSEAHRKNMLKYLRAIFRYAVENDIIPKDPCPKLKFKKNEKIKKVLNESEIRIFLQKAKEQNHVWFPIWTLACYTGLRNGELYAPIKTGIVPIGSITDQRTIKVLIISSISIRIILHYYLVDTK